MSGVVIRRLVASRSNPAWKRLRALRRDPRRRDALGVFLAEGVHLAEEALRARAPIEMAVVSSGLHRLPGGPDVMRRLEEAGTEVLETTERVLESLQEARSPQPILLVVRRVARDLDSVLEGRPGVPLAVVAHGVQDPGNLGAILRTADAAGATCFLAAGESADLYHPRTVRATMGSIFRLPCARTEDDRLPSVLRARAWKLVGTDAAASVPHDGLDLCGPIALFFGREGSGLPADLGSQLDVTVRIAMHPGVNSLSVGAAAAVLLYEASRQRRHAGRPDP